MSYVLTAVDTSGIQPYIFGSNRLRENVGASEHVLRATTTWIWETLRDPGLKLRVNMNDSWPTHGQPRDDRKLIEDPDQNLDAEVLYAAGGNALILFRDEDMARTWARLLSTKALRDAPGLTLLIAHSAPFAWNPTGNDLAARVGDLFSMRLDEHKRTRTASAPLLGLGVTATCQSTGLVATTVDTLDNIRVSREIVAKTSSIPDARGRFRGLLQNYEKLDIPLPEKFDEMNPNKGERSYIAVIHADGNGMGEHFKHIWDGKTNRAGITALRDLSDKVAQAGALALQQTLACLVDANGVLVHPYHKMTKLPVRPLIYGGDDLTLVCDGRIGVGLAARYLYEFEQATRHLFGEPLTAAAGVAIVKTHYPFVRAYELAAALCRDAKKISRDVSMLDWHVAMSGVLAHIREIRAREYAVEAGQLELRPVSLREPLSATDAWRSWEHVEAVIVDLQTHADWAGKRNKIKRLREVLREGGAAVKQFCTVYQTGELPGYPAQRNLREQGWVDQRCGYFDPIELLDLYVPPAGKQLEEGRWLPTT